MYAVVKANLDISMPFLKMRKRYFVIRQKLRIKVLTFYDPVTQCALQGIPTTALQAYFRGQMSTFHD